MVTVTKVKKSGAKKLKRGELLHNDQDAMEYSDEEQNEADAELATALQTIAKKAEVPELAKMTHDEVLAYRMELESIKVKGKKCTKPVKTWAQCGLTSKVLDIMKKNQDRPSFI